jgi:hypothetical protein
VWLGLPSGAVSYLAVPTAERLPVLSQEPSNTCVATLEPVSYERHRCLVVVFRAGERLQVNGHVPPVAAVLHIGDQIRVRDDCVLHLSMLNRPHVAAPRERDLGTECPFCRVKFVPNTTVYVCPYCDGAVHCEGEERSVDERLECARLTTECPRCMKPVSHKEGYAYVPEL